MWIGASEPFLGSHYQLDEPINSPQPLTRPHPPILIGGEGERKLLRLVAEYGDACNFFIGSPLDGLPPSWRSLYADRLAHVRRKLAILEAHCHDVGRPGSTIEKTVQVYLTLARRRRFPGKEILELCAELAGLGVGHPILNMPDAFALEPIRRMGDSVSRSLAETC